MGWFDGFRRRRAEAAAERDAAHAAQAVAAARASWQSEQDSLDRLTQTATKLQRGEDITASIVLTKKGELAVWVGAAALHEARRGATHYEGGSQGVSIPLGHTGVRYRVGAMKGQAVQGPDVDALVDVGMVTLTTERLVLTGDMATREWDFDKLIGVECDETEQRYTFHVSNRQKPSTLDMGECGSQFNDVLSLVLAIHKFGVADVVKQCEQSATEHLASRPTK